MELTTAAPLISYSHTHMELTNPLKTKPTPIHTWSLHPEKNRRLLPYTHGAYRREINIIKTRSYLIFISPFFTKKLQNV
jgi:hypothetical protein